MLVRIILAILIGMLFTGCTLLDSLSVDNRDMATVEVYQQEGEGNQMRLSFIGLVPPQVRRRFGNVLTGPIKYYIIVTNTKTLQFRRYSAAMEDIHQNGKIMKITFDTSPFGK